MKIGTKSLLFGAHQFILHPKGIQGTEKQNKLIKDILKQIRKL